MASKNVSREKLRENAAEAAMKKETQEVCGDGFHATMMKTDGHVPREEMGEHFITGGN